MSISNSSGLSVLFRLLGRPPMRVLRGELFRLADFELSGTDESPSAITSASACAAASFSATVSFGERSSGWTSADDRRLRIYTMD